MATIVGVDNDNVLVGRTASTRDRRPRGDDVVIGRSGNDTICLGDGDDRVIAGAGDDFIAGDPGEDTILAGAGRESPCRPGRRRRQRWGRRRLLTARRRGRRRGQRRPGPGRSLRRPRRRHPRRRQRRRHPARRTAATACRAARARLAVRRRRHDILRAGTGDDVRLYASTATTSSTAGPARMPTARAPRTPMATVCRTSAPRPRRQRRRASLRAVALYVRIFPNGPVATPASTSSGSLPDPGKPRHRPDQPVARPGERVEVVLEDGVQRARAEAVEARLGAPRAPQKPRGRARRPGGRVHQRERRPPGRAAGWRGGVAGGIGEHAPQGAPAVLVDAARTARKRRIVERAPSAPTIRSYGPYVAPPASTSVPPRARRPRRLPAAPPPRRSAAPRSAANSAPRWTPRP